MTPRVTDQVPPPFGGNGGRHASGAYPQWFEGVTDQAGKPVAVFCPRCGAQLTVLGCSVPTFTGFIIHPHRCPDGGRPPGQ